MMNATDFMQLQTEAFKASNALAAKSMEGMQKLADLNMKVTKSTLEASTEQVKTLLGAKDAKALTEALSEYAKPNEALTAYAKSAYEIATQTNADLAKLVDEQVENGNQQLFDVIDNMAKNAPAGTESAISFVKQYLTASRSAYEQAAKAGKQFTDMAQANVVAATDVAATKATKKAA